MSINERLQLAIFEHGLTVEQIGVEFGVDAEISGGYITLSTSEYEETVNGFDEAIEVLEEWADEFVAIPNQPAPIIDFVHELSEYIDNDLVNPFRDVFALDIQTVAHDYGLSFYEELQGEDDVVSLDDDEIGFFEDHNGVFWLVYIDDDEINYEIVPLD